MKKILVSILALFYLTSSIGVTVHLHYCMDRLVAWGFGNERANNKSCPYCGMTKTSEDKHCGKQGKGCCKNEQKQIKIEKDQKTVEVGNDVGKLLIPSTAHIPSATFFVEEIFSPAEEYPVTHAPPQAGNLSLLIRNCVFRI